MHWSTGARTRAPRSVDWLAGALRLVVGIAILDIGIARADASEPPEAPATTVSVYQPEQAMNGYTLDIADGLFPTLYDMNGRSVHVWRDARVRERTRLLDNCNLLALGRGRFVIEYDWKGNVVWEHRTPESITHHDVLRLRNGNTMFLIAPNGSNTDEILEVAPDGREVWRWESVLYMGDEVRHQSATNARRDITHLNTLEELEDNRWFRAGDTRFRPGNLLVSSPTQNVIFVVDKQTKQIVWEFKDELYGQHEPQMIPDGFPGAGNLLVFNNRTRRDGSQIIEIDPSKDEIIWRYDTLGFFSPSKGVEQPLQNGNILVTSSRAGRIFEITRDADIVWEFVRYYSNRARRYPYDHCPDLKNLAQPKQIPVTAAVGHRHIDHPLYRWKDRKTLLEEIALKELRVLRSNDGCDELLIPTDASLHLHFGLRPIAIEQAGIPDYTGRFRLYVSPKNTSERTELLDVTLRAGEEMSRRTQVDLRAYAYQRLSICTQTDASGTQVPEKTRKFAYWEVPRVGRAGALLAPRDEDNELGDNPEGFTAEELELRSEQLKALGYVD